MMMKNLFYVLIVIILTGWAGYLYLQEYPITAIYPFSLPMVITMVVGAFIAGASSEGGGAVAFPVMTLLLNISPLDARVFSLGIQSFGMTVASTLILSRGIKVVKRCLLIVGSSGILGFILGDVLWVDLLPPQLTKLFFVSLWLSFGLALWMINRKSSVEKRSDLPNRLTGVHYVYLAVFGAIGGMVSATFGNGVDIMTFTLLTLYFRVDEKVATSTSVVLMTIVTIFGFLWHLIVKDDVSFLAERYLVGVIPVVIFLAPLGAYVVSKVSASIVAKLLYSVIVVQFLTAIWVIRPDILQIVFSFLVFIIGTVIFHLMAKHSNQLEH